MVACMTRTRDALVVPDGSVHDKDQAAECLRDPPEQLIGFVGVSNVLMKFWKDITAFSWTLERLTPTFISSSTANRCI